MNRVVKGFIISPMALGLLMSIFNALFGDSEFHFVPIMIGFVIYSLFAYFFTALLAVPAYFIVKKNRREKGITYSITSIVGFIAGIGAGIFLMSGIAHIPSVFLFGVIGFGLSNIFWYIAIK